MFNNFNLDDVEILKILDDYNPLITSMSRLRNGIDEDLMQEIKYMIYKTLTKNRKKLYKMQHRIKKIGLLILEGGNNMDEKENTNQVAEVKNLKETKNFSKTKDVISKNNSKTEIELITAYAQLAFHTLKNSNTDITAKSIKEEVTMFYEKFGNTEVKRLANIIMKEKKEKK